MAPHRRGSAPSKRHPQQLATTGSQPSQHGIQRFFGKDPRSSSAVGNDSRSPPSAPQPCQDHVLGETVVASKAATEVTPVAGGAHMKQHLGADTRRKDKRLRISPGMLIQQSQDDGWDQVVWRVSPTAERLQGASAVDNTNRTTKLDASALQCNKNACNLPNMHDVLTRASSGPSEKSGARPGKKRSPGLAGKLERWLSTSEIRPVNQRDNCCASVGGLKIVAECTTIQDNVSDYQQTPSALRGKENACLGHICSLPKTSQSQGQRQTVPSSLSRRSMVIKSQKKKGSVKHKGSGQRRKALLELLDKVENVISVSDSTSNIVYCNSVHSHDRQLKVIEVCQPLDRGSDRKAPTEGRHMIGAAMKHGDVDAESVREDSCVLTLDNLSRTARETCAEEEEGAPCVLDTESDHKLLQSDDPNMKGTGTAVQETAVQESDEQICTKSPTAASEALASIHFLVLEVADLADECKGFSARRKVVRLLNEHSGLERVLYLIDEWFFTVVRPGDTVNVIGEFDLEGKCVIDRNNSLLIVHPDVLISGSKVGSSFSCPRRAVLDERIRSSSVAFAALLGTMMHELFQIGLVSNATSKAILEQEAELIVQQHISSLCACGGDEREALGKLKDSIPTILNWLDCFLHGSSPALPKVDFGRKDGQLSISVSEVIDIEEMIYSPKFGLKGMIDASMKVKLSCINLGAEDQILPLEFKTGKGTTGQAALEHRAQVILYSLLMSDRYLQNIDRGLLYYLYTNQTEGVAVQHADLVGLIMRRNEHATNLLAASLTQHLPPMIQSQHMCQSCWHLDVCSIYHKGQEGGTADSSGLGELFDEQTEHLNSSHFEFIKLWDRLIDLEAQDLQGSQREIWRLPSKQREEAGRCLSSMRIDLSFVDSQNEQSKASCFVFPFFRDISYSNQSNCSEKGRHNVQMGGLHEQAFSCGDRVLLSTEAGHVAVAAGVICEIAEHFVLIKFSHQLRLPAKDGLSDKEQLLRQTWRIDKDETASFLATMRFNVLQLFLKNDGHEHGRQLIVDLKPPRFDSGGLFSQDPAALYVRSASDLNDDQRRAIFKILAARDYALVLGMPGTGKTSTIVHAVRALLTRGASILLTSYTNSAVDNILLKLKSQGVDFVRLGRESAIHPELKEHVVEGLGHTTVKDLELRMTEVRVVAATCLGVTHPLLTNKKFDVCIVDEAGQITLPVSLGPLRFADTFVLVGDHYQLPPLVRNAEARENGLAVSLFRRLSEAHPQAISALQCQYRMCAGIMKHCNTLIYGNRLRCGSPEVANAHIKITDDLNCHPFWLQKTMDAAQSVLFLDTDLLSAHETRIRSAVHNTAEASIVLKVIKTLLDVGLDAKEIGVISPYNYQVQHIRKLVVTEGLMTIEVHTIDRFQGRDKDCVLVSLVKSTNQGRSSATLLADWHRINVAITRARKKLILIGSQRTLSATPVLKLLIKQVEQGGGLVRIPQEAGLLFNGLRQCSTVGSNR